MSKKDPGMTELNGYIPKELKIKFKSLCAAQDRSMSEVLVELISEWINLQDNASATPSNDSK